MPFTPALVLKRFQSALPGDLHMLDLTTAFVKACGRSKSITLRRASLEAFEARLRNWALLDAAIGTLVISPDPDGPMLSIDRLTEPYARYRRQALEAGLKPLAFRTFRFRAYATCGGPYGS